jgi:hypothetical protein
VWGEGNALKNEVQLSPTQGALFSVSFDHVLWKVDQNPVPATIAAAISQAPQFRSVTPGGLLFDFRLEPASPAINQGKPSAVGIDLDGRRRPVGLPDIGAYEVQ